MERMADGLAAFMVSAGMIKDENRKYYRYGMELLLSNFFNFFVIFYFFASLDVVSTYYI